MADEFSAGASKFRSMVKVFDTIEDLIKAARRSGKERAHFNKFDKAMEKYDHAINDATVAVYKTEGLGAGKMRELLDEHNIPNITVTDNKTGMTSILVPIDFKYQATLLFNMEQIVTPQTPQTSTINQDAAIRQVVANAHPSNSIEAVSYESILKSPDTVYFQFKNDNFAHYIKDCCAEQGIMGVEITVKNGKTYLAVPKTHETAVDVLIQNAQRTRSELQSGEFARAMKGHEIIIHDNLTFSQVQQLRKSLRGTCVQYTVQEQPNGTYSLKYNAERMRTVEPRLLSAVLTTQGVSGKSVEAQTRAVEGAIENARTAVQNNEGIVAIDATRDENDPERGFIVDKSGIKTLDGKELIVSKSDPNFDAELHARIAQQQAPLVKSFDIEKKPDIPNLYTLAEINAARRGAALSNPELCTVLSSQIILCSMENAAQAGNATTAMYVQAGVSEAYKLANAIEEEGERRSFDELKNDPSIPDGYHDLIDELHEAAAKLSPEERSEVAKALRDTSDSIQERLTANEYISRPIDMRDMSLEDIEATLNHEDTSRDENDRDAHGNPVTEEPVAPDDSVSGGITADDII